MKMSLNQISVFLENKPGRLQALTDILAAKNINLRALSLAETAEFGIVRIIVDDLDVASAVLKEEGYVYTISKVLGVAIPDDPGGLNRVLQILNWGSINIEYMYAFLGGKSATHAYMIFHVKNREAAAAALAAEGIECIAQDELTNM